AELCLTEAAAQPLQAAHFNRISLPVRPDEEAMMALTLAFARGQPGSWSVVTSCNPRTADSKGTSAPEPRKGKPAASRSGAVKPPVLDLKPRETGAEAKPAEASQPEPSRAAPGKPASEKPAAAAASPARRNGGFPVVAILAGGALGVAAAYGLASFGLWPSQPAAPQPSDPRLAQFATAIPELETVTQTTQ